MSDKFNKINLRSFRGPALAEDSTDQNAEVLRVAKNAVLRPAGSVSRAPVFARLWQLGPLSSYMAGLGLGPEDQTVLLRVKREGHVFLVALDCVSHHLRGVCFAGYSTDAGTLMEPPTLAVAATGANMEVLCRGLDVSAQWVFEPAQGRTLMGNRVDPNYIYSPEPPEFRRMADQMRPFAPQGSAVTPSESIPANATYQFNHVLFKALEPDFKPVSDETYRRGEGNNVIVDVVQGFHTGGFRSEISGKGTWSDPYRYRVLCPDTDPDPLPNEAELVGYILRDSQAQGIVTAELVGMSGEIELFNGARAFGGITSFEKTDTFASPQIDACLTYFKKDPTGRGRGFETAPSPIVTLSGTGSNQVQIQVFRDTEHPDAGYYDAIRIYLSAYELQRTEQGWKEADGATYYDQGEVKATKGYATEGYSAFKLALEVKNEDGVYTLAPSLISGVALDANNRVPLPAGMFIDMYGRIFMAGHPGQPMRVTYTRSATADTKLPEGTALENYIDLDPRGDNDEITALKNFGGTLVAYTKFGAYLIPPNFYETGVRDGKVVAGAIGSQVVAAQEGGGQIFLGSDYNLYRLSAPQNSSENNDAPISSLLNRRLGPCLKEFADDSRSRAAHSFFDYTQNQWWIWVARKMGEGDEAGEGMAGFCYDFNSQDLTGPFDAPQLTSSTQLNLKDSRVIGADAQGNLVVLALGSTLPRDEVYLNNSGVTIHAADATPPDPAFPVIDLPTSAKRPAGGRIFRGSSLEISTGWLSTAGSGQAGAVYVVEWNLVEGSAGYMFVKLYGQRGREEIYEIGEVFNRPYGKKQMAFAGNPVRGELLVYCGDDKPFALRNLQLSVLPHGRR